MVTEHNYDAAPVSSYRVDAKPRSLKDFDFCGFGVHSFSASAAEPQQTFSDVGDFRVLATVSRP